jgi:selenocysteine lyase/cysteine desulfurase
MHEIASVLEACERVGAISVVDAYHAFNAVPLDWGPALRSAFIVSGGYKYAGFGNGLCWMRLPEHTELRPADTGWFADFDALAAPRVVDGVLVARPVGYGQGAARFAGATFEASAFYRARAVLRHWDALGLGVAELRALYVAQTRLILDGLTARRVLGEGRPLERVSADEDARRGAFVSVRHPNAGGLSAALRERGIWTDSRGMNLRLGPAPYVLDAEIERALDVLADLVR